MKLPDIFPVALVLWFANQLIVESKITCSKNQYIVVKNGTESCLACNSCPDGRGLSPPCGSKVNHPPPIDCVPCVPGKTYSDEYGPSSCKNCHLCSAKEIVTRNCTTTENTICSNTCEEGYYYENSTHDCQPCSECCNKGSDIVIKECKSMPPNKQCSALSAKKCKPKPTNVIVTTYPRTTKGTSSISASEKPSTKVIAFSIAGVVVGAILIIVLICVYKRRKKTKRMNINRNATGEDGAHDQLLSDMPDHCNLNHLHLSVTNNSPNKLSEGQIIRLSLIFDNDNGDNNRKCNFGFEWKKDGDSISKNDYDNRSKDLVIDDVEVADSGQYYCEIHCVKHPNKNENSSPVEIHVKPGKGKELKLFSEVGRDIEEKIENLLQMHSKPIGIGNWMDLGRLFKMDEDALKALDKDQAASVLEHIKSSQPKLTVFKFCEEMKKDTMKQNKIVNLLANELTKPKRIPNSGIDVRNRPDSGIEEELDSDELPVKALASSKPSQLMISAQVNLGHGNSSQEASGESSVEDLPRSCLPTVQNFKKKSRYGRQTSKDSQKSDDMEDSIGTRERKRSRSSSITSSIKEKFQKQQSVEYSAPLLDHHHEESDEGALS